MPFGLKSKMESNNSKLCFERILIKIDGLTTIFDNKLRDTCLIKATPKHSYRLMLSNTFQMYLPVTQIIFKLDSLFKQPL